MNTQVLDREFILPAPDGTVIHSTAARRLLMCDTRATVTPLAIVTQPTVGWPEPCRAR